MWTGFRPIGIKAVDNLTKEEITSPSTNNNETSNNVNSNNQRYCPPSKDASGNYTSDECILVKTLTCPDTNKSSYQDKNACDGDFYDTKNNNLVQCAKDSKGTNADSGYLQSSGNEVHADGSKYYYWSGGAVVGSANTLEQDCQANGGQFILYGNYVKVGNLQWQVGFCGTCQKKDAKSETKEYEYCLTVGNQAQCTKGRFTSDEKRTALQVCNDNHNNTCFEIGQCNNNKCSQKTSILDPNKITTDNPIQVEIKTDSLTSGTLDSINPLRNSTTFGTKANRTPGHILSVLIKNIIFPAAGLLLFLLIVYGGFTIVQGSTMGNDSVVSAGKQRVTAAVVGFLLLFSSYWLWQIVELALGLGATG